MVATDDGSHKSSQVTPVTSRERFDAAEVFHMSFIVVDNKISSLINLCVFSVLNVALLHVDFPSLGVTRLVVVRRVKMNVCFNVLVVKVNDGSDFGLLNNFRPLKHRLSQSMHLRLKAYLILNEVELRRLNRLNIFILDIPGDLESRVNVSSFLQDLSNSFFAD